MIGADFPLIADLAAHFGIKIGFGQQQRGFAGSVHVVGQSGAIPYGRHMRTQRLVQEFGLVIRGVHAHGGKFRQNIVRQLGQILLAAPAGRCGPCRARLPSVFHSQLHPHPYPVRGQ